MTPHCSVSTSNDGRRWGVQGHQLQRPCYLDIQIETRTHSIACLRVRVFTHFSEGKWCYFWNVTQPNNECISAILYKLMMHHTEIGTSWARTGTKKVYAFFREAEVKWRCSLHPSRQLYLYNNKTILKTDCWRTRDIVNKIPCFIYLSQSRRLLAGYFHLVGKQRLRFWRWIRRPLQLSQSRHYS